MKEVERKELSEATKKRQEARDLYRKTEFAKAQNSNLQMHGQILEQYKNDRFEFLKEKDNIQTSIKSKKLDDA